MSLQKSGKVYNSILVEQVVLTSSYAVVLWKIDHFFLTLTVFNYFEWLQNFSTHLYGRQALQFFTQMLTDSVVQYKKKSVLLLIQLCSVEIFCIFYDLNTKLDSVLQDLPSVPRDSSGSGGVQPPLLFVLRPHGERPVQKHHWKQRVQHRIHHPHCAEMFHCVDVSLFLQVFDETGG